MHRLIHHNHGFTRAIIKNSSIVAKAFIHLQRRNFDAAKRAQAALVIHIKAAHSVQLVIKPFYAYRCAAVDGVHVQNVATQAKLPQRIHLLCTLVAQSQKCSNKLVLFVLLPYCKLQRFVRNAARTQLLLLQCLSRNKDNAALLTGQKAERRSTSCLQLQALRIRLHPWQAHRIQLLHRQLRVKIAQLAAVGTHLLARGRNKGQTAACPQKLIHSSKKDRLAAASQPG